jgi:hypothetical protein
MTLMNAPTYDERKEKLKKTILITTGLTFVLLILITLGGYIDGHGWFFTNLPAEHKVSTFFAALQAKDYNKAFAIYNNDPDWQQHPEKYADYPQARFQEDWTTQDPIKGPVNSYHVDISRTDGEGAFGTGIIVAVTVNGNKRVFMYYIRKTGALTWPAYHELQY